MRCPYCGHEDTQVAETRDTDEGSTRRRRRCLKCDRRFTTFERPEVAMPAVVKRDGKVITLDASFLVPGDMVVLGSGSAVPADCIINEGTIDVDQVKKKSSTARV
jgi:transcriptional repressor NrdR